MSRTGAVVSGEILTFARFRPLVDDADDDRKESSRSNCSNSSNSSRRVAYEVHHGHDENKDEVCALPFFVDSSTVFVVDVWVDLV